MPCCSVPQPIGYIKGEEKHRKRKKKERKKERKRENERMIQVREKMLLPHMEEIPHQIGNEEKSMIESFHGNFNIGPDQNSFHVNLA